MGKLKRWEAECGAEGLMYEKRLTRMWCDFSALQVQCTAAALPCMPGAWIISPSRRGAIKAYGENNSRRRRRRKRRAYGLDGWERQRRQNSGESWALVMNSNLRFGPSLKPFFFFFFSKKKKNKIKKRKKKRRGGGGWRGRESHHTNRVPGIRVHQSGLSACGLPLDASKLI